MTDDLPARSEQSTAVRQALSDPRAVTTRRQVLGSLADSLLSCGQAVRLEGHLIGPERAGRESPWGNGQDAVVSVGYLAEAASALMRGAEALLDLPNQYGAAALLRQLVEVEYLMWAFSEDEAEARSWLRATADERRHRWQPRHVRARAGDRFRGRDYGTHCELGGHPTPPGLRQLLDVVEDSSIAELLRVELAHHGTSTWQYFLAAVDRAGTSHCLPQQQVHHTTDHVAAWKSSEQAFAAGGQP